MALFASPFFQNILSLTDHCVPPPPVTTYQNDFMDPKLKREPEYTDPGTKKTLDALGIKRKDGKVPICICQSSQTGKKETLKKKPCAKIITTYMVSYPSPEERLKRWENFLANKAAKDSDKSPAQSDSAEAQAKASAPQNLNATCECRMGAKKDQDHQEKATQVFASKLAAPQWKVDGWKAKQNCWIRPLEERREYYTTLQYRSSNENIRNKCCIH